jgi:hypothetical protein
MEDIRRIFERLPQGFEPDCLLYFDDSYSVSVLGLEQVELPMMFYSIDAHHHVRWHSQFSGLFDAVAVAQKDYLPLFDTASGRSAAGWLHWLPLWAPVEIQPETARDIPLSFRGTMDSALHPGRQVFFDDVSRVLGSNVDAASGPYADIYCRSKIVLNQNVSGDVNFRVFEAMMCGALLITPRASNGFAELFEEGRDLVAYSADAADEAAGLAAQYLADEDERSRIAAQGREKVRRFHSPQARAQDIERILRSTAAGPRPRRHFAAAAAYLQAYVAYSEERQAEQEVLLSAARDNLMLSAARGETDGEEFRVAVLLCKCYLELLGVRNTPLDFSERIHRAYPEDPILILCYLEELIESGHDRRALEIAARISSSPQELLHGLKPLMQAAKEQIKKTLPFELPKEKV